MGRKIITSRVSLMLKVTPMLNRVQVEDLENVRVSMKAKTSEDQEPVTVEVKLYDDGLYGTIPSEALRAMKQGMLRVETVISLPKTQVTKELDMFTVINDWVEVASDVTELGYLSHEWN